MMRGDCGLIFGVLLLSICGLCACSLGNEFRPVKEHVVSVNEQQTIHMTTQELYNLLAKGEKVFDRTYLDSKQQGVKFTAESPALPTQINYQQEVDALNSNLDVTDMYNRLLSLSSFHNRFYTSQFGVNSAEWIYHQYQEMIQRYPNDGVTRSVEFFNHTWPQPSVIARIEGIGSNKNEKVIIGAHEDSVNWDADNQNIALAPGACDDGSGTVTVMEVFRVICETGSAFNRTIEFHHYAAEEVGLLGSQDIASYYAANSVPVAGYLNFDMDGYPGNPATFNLITDYTNADLNNYVIQLIEAYTQLSYTSSKCGYACSDHASWDEENYRASFAIENGPYPYTHTSEDSIVYIDFEYVLQYAKLGMGFLVEVASYMP